jgi:nitrite reductase (cytochrome c-552)
LGKLVEEKMVFLDGLNKQLFEAGKATGIYDAKSREGMQLKTSYN